MDQFARTTLIFGEAAMERLHRSRVAVFGLGGVGGYVVEALVRSGVGTLDLIDNDRVSLTNLNRQIIATHETVGMRKTDAAEARAKAISPDAVIHKHDCFFLPETAGQFDFSAYDYVVDAIDTVAGKIGIVAAAHAAGTPVISSMGTGNKLDPARLRISDISETAVCPLARVMRRELRARGIRRLKVVWSDEVPSVPDEETMRNCMQEEDVAVRRSVPGSTAFVPPVAGLLIAGEVVRDLCGVQSKGGGI